MNLRLPVIVLKFSVWSFPPIHMIRAGVGFGMIEEHKYLLHFLLEKLIAHLRLRTCVSWLYSHSLHHLYVAKGVVMQKNWKTRFINYSFQVSKSRDSLDNHISAVNCILSVYQVWSLLFLGLIWLTFVLLHHTEIRWKFGELQVWGNPGLWKPQKYFRNSMEEDRSPPNNENWICLTATKCWIDSTRWWWNSASSRKMINQNTPH